MRTELYSLAADGVLLLHAAFVLFVVGGQLLILLGWWRQWRWPRNKAFRVGHLAAIAYVVLESWLGVICPLTELESWLRGQAGQAAYELGFIAHWVQRLLFYSAPPWVFALLYTAFASLVIASFLLYPPVGTGGWKQRSKNAE